MRKVRRSRSFHYRKAQKAIERCWPDAKRMEDAADGIVNSKFRDLTESEKHRILRFKDKIILESKVFSSLRNDLYESCSSEEEKLAKAEAFIRIPRERLVDLRKLGRNERLAMLAELMEEFGSNTGNRCDHNVSFFACDQVISPYDSGTNFDSKLRTKRKPQIIYETIDRLILSVLFPEDYKSLFFRKTNTIVKLHGDAHRQIRSEGRESMLKVLIVLLLAWDPRSMRSGHYNPDERLFWGIRIAKISEWSGLSKSRVKNALRLLEKMDIIYKGKQKKEIRKDGTWKGHPVVRVFKQTLWFFLGLGKRLNERERVDPGLRKETPADRKPENRSGVPESELGRDSGGFSSADDILSSGLLDD